MGCKYHYCHGFTSVPVSVCQSLCLSICLFIIFLCISLSCCLSVCYSVLFWVFHHHVYIDIYVYFFLFLSIITLVSLDFWACWNGCWVTVLHSQGHKWCAKSQSLPTWRSRTRAEALDAVINYVNYRLAVTVRKDWMNILLLEPGDQRFTPVNSWFIPMLMIWWQLYQKVVDDSS